jgi:ketosteroid isomerase-like protein
VSEADVTCVREAAEMFLRNDRDAALARWAEDCVSIAPEEWPEARTTESREQAKALFESFDEAFGPDWPTQMRIEQVEDAGGGRVLATFHWTASGVSSGAAVEGELSGIYTVKDDEIVHVEWFLGHEKGRKAAGLD